MSKSIGIDLGTSNSSAAIKKITTEVLSNKEGEVLTPSCVNLQKKNKLLGKSHKTWLVGRLAKEWLAQDPANTVLSVKRLMGRSFIDHEVQKIITEKRFAYTVQPLTDGSSKSVAILLHGQEYTPEEISSKILKKIKLDSEKQLNDDIDRAVVTVPAYFNDKQKHATRIAAARAGLKIQRLLPEPTAAALSFGVGSMSKDESQTILVYDFGGGTLDLSILTIADGQFIEQGKSGDMWCGGDDIDCKIIEFVYAQTEIENNLKNGSILKLFDKLQGDRKNRFLSEIKQKAEKAKIDLSFRDKTVIEVLGLLKDEDGDLLDIDVEISRAQFEELILPMVDRSLVLAVELVKEIGFDLSLIDKVLMVGGSSNIPLILKRAKEVFGEKKVLLHERPMFAIAEGAAILAHRLSDKHECPECGTEILFDAEKCPKCGFGLDKELCMKDRIEIIHTTSHDYTLELEDGTSFLLVERNMPLPFESQYLFKMVHHEQRLVHLKFFNEVNSTKESIGDLWLSLDFDQNYGEGKKELLEEILLKFKLDENNIITVFAEIKNHKDIKVTRTLSRGKEDEKLYLSLDEAINAVNNKEQSFYVKMDFLTRSIEIAKLINEVLDQETTKVKEDIYLKVKRLQRVAIELNEQNLAPNSKICYVDVLLKRFDSIMPPKEKQQLQDKLCAVRKKVEDGTIGEITRGLDVLQKELENHSHLVPLNTLENAIEIAYRNGSKNINRLREYRDKLIDSLLNDNFSKYNSDLDKITPEVLDIIDTQGNRSLRIWKEVSAC